MRKVDELQTMPSVNKLAKSKHGKSKNGKRCASVKLPFVRAVNDDPIPPLSPVLCNHYYPKLRLVKPEDNGLYWVSPQCNKATKRVLARDTKKNKNINGSKTKMSRNKLGQPNVNPTLADAEENFSPSKFNCDILVPETPVDQQGLTLKEKLLRKSYNLRRVSSMRKEA